MGTTNQAIHVRLDETNYPTWVYLMQHHLRSHGLLKFVDGSYPCPSPFPFEDDGTSSDNSGLYERWLEQDSSAICMVANTLSADALTLVIGCQTSREVWLTLKQRYAFVSEFHIMQLKSTLQTIQKGSNSIEKYLLRFKCVRDKLAAAEVTMTDQDVKNLIIAGLPIEYSHARQIIRGKKDIGMEEVRSLLLSAEFEIELKHKQSTLSSLTGMVAQNNMTVRQGTQSNWSPSVASYNCSVSSGIAKPNAYFPPFMSTGSVYLNAAPIPAITQIGYMPSASAMICDTGFINAASVSHSTGYESSFGANAMVNNGVVSNGTCNSGPVYMMNKALVSNASQDEILSSPYTNTKQLYGSSGTSVPHWNYYGNEYRTSYAYEDEKDISFVLKNRNSSYLNKEVQGSLDPMTGGKQDVEILTRGSCERGHVREKEKVVHSVQECMHTKKNDMVGLVFQDQKIATALGAEQCDLEKMNCNGIESVNVEESVSQLQQVSKSGPKALSATICTHLKPPSVTTQLNINASQSQDKPLQVAPTSSLSIPFQSDTRLHSYTRDKNLMNCRQACESTNLWQLHPLIPPG